MTNDALKPCPFCGGDADIDEFEGKLLETVFAASCNNDDCPIGHKDHGSWPTKTDALNSWNTRAALAPVDLDTVKEIENRWGDRFLELEEPVPEGMKRMGYVVDIHFLLTQLKSARLVADINNELKGE